jgi:hypothetical protein
MGWISDPAEPLLRAPSARMCAAADSFIGSTSRPAVISDTESAGEWGTRESECTGMTPRMGGLGLPLLPAEAPPLVPPLLPLALDSLLRVTAGGSGAIAGSFCCLKNTQHVARRRCFCKMLQCTCSALLLCTPHQPAMSTAAAAAAGLLRAPRAPPHLNSGLHDISNKGSKCCTHKNPTSKEEAERGEPELSPLSKLVVRSSEAPPKEP